MNGKTILVTGSTDGVGRYVAERLAADGASVIVHGRDQARGDGLVERIAKQGGEARFLRADLASLAEVCTLAEAVRDTSDGLDALVKQRRHRHERREARAQRRRLRAQVRGQLSGWLSPNPPPARPSRATRAGAHRQCLVGRAAADRLFRRDADAWLQRRARLLPEQA